MLQGGTLACGWVRRHLKMDAGLKFEMIVENLGGWWMAYSHRHRHCHPHLHLHWGWGCGEFYCFLNPVTPTHPADHTRIHIPTQQLLISFDPLTRVKRKCEHLDWEKFSSHRMLSIVSRLVALIALVFNQMKYFQARIFHRLPFIDQKLKLKRKALNASCFHIFLCLSKVLIMCGWWSLKWGVS